MSRNRGNLWLVFVVGFVGVFALASGVSSGSSHTTEDDSESVLDAFHSSGTGVLGIDDDSDKACPDDKPVMGWIDYRGEKKIVDHVPDNQDPSACFSSIENAKTEGYDR